MSPCLTSCCPCRGAPAQAPRQWQHEVRQGDTHDSGSAAILGVRLPNQQTKFGDGPVRVKALRLGRRSGSSWITRVCRHAVPTLPVATAHHRNDTHAPKECQRIVPSPSQPSPILWGNHCGSDDCHGHTHTVSQNHCARDVRNSIDI